MIANCQCSGGGEAAGRRALQCGASGRRAGADGSGDPGSIQTMSTAMLDAAKCWLRDKC